MQRPLLQPFAALAAVFLPTLVFSLGLTLAAADEPPAPKAPTPVTPPAPPESGSYILGIYGEPTRVMLPVAMPKAAPPPSAPRTRIRVTPPAPEYAPYDGLRITHVYAGYPATRMKGPGGALFTVNVGDVLLSVNGQSVRDIATLRAALDTSKGHARLGFHDTQSPDWVSFYDVDWPGSLPDPIPDDSGPKPVPTNHTGPYLLGVIGQPTQVKIRHTLAAAPTGPPNAPPLRIRPHYTFETRTGVVVTQITPGSVATRLTDDQGKTWVLTPGDVILTIDGRNLTNLDDIRAALAGCKGKAVLEVYDPAKPEQVSYFHANW